MPITSYHFLFILFPIALVLYHMVQPIYKKYIILLANLYFIFYLGIIPTLIIIFSGFVYYFAGLLLGKKHCKWILFSAILINVFILIFFKYNTQLAGFPPLNNYSEGIVKYRVFAPIGISFYTFQGISYIADVYKKKIGSEKDIIKFFCYFTFFATITSGPIIRYEDFDQENSTYDYDAAFEGVKRIIFGLFKKLYLSSRFAFLTNTLWGNAETNFAIAWIATIAFTLQIYLDFSGYSDIAIGVAKCFNLNFKENFNYPYMAESMTDFWRRWHISLSQWFRDYIYIPLGGNRVTLPRMLFNMLVVWLLTGIWHGSTVTFIVWGLLNFVSIIFERFFFGNILKKAPKFLRHLYTLIIINVIWVFFRSTSVIQGVNIIKTMFSFQGGITDLYKGLTYVLLYKMDWILAILVSTPLLKIAFDKLEMSKYKILNICFYLILAVLFIIVIVLAISSSYQSFLYEAF